MTYTIVKEMLVGDTPIDNIWVAQDNDQDPIYTFTNEQKAIDKAAALQKADATGRKYKAIQTA